MRNRFRKNESQLGWSVLAFVIPVVICLVILALDKVYPFGERCILHVDMYHQYCPFFTEFLHKLKAGESLMYSWNIGLGSDFISVFVYYLSSPLNWLIVFCPEQHVIEFMTGLILFKIGFSGYSFRKFCSWHFSQRKPAAEVVFAAAYALSGFVAAYCWDIMWMDCIALAPLIFIGLEKLMKEGKPALYYITLSLSILCNYYMSIMICLFLVFYFALIFIEMDYDPVNSRWMGLKRFTIYSLLAGGTGVVLMLPEMIILGYSGSSGFNFPDSVEWYFNILSETMRMCTDAAVYTSTKHWPNLYAGAFSILLLFLYVINGEIPIRKKIPRILMAAFFLISFANNWLDFIWHGLHYPDSLPGRQSFLFVFLVLVMGYEVIIHLEEIRIWQIFVALIAAIAVLVAGLSVVDSSITDPEAIYITMMLIGVYSLLLLLEKLWKQEKTTIRVIAGLVALVELFANMYDTGFATVSRTAYMAKTDKYETLLQIAEEDAMELSDAESADQVFYRVEDTERLCKNDDARYGYASATQFSSLMNINVSHFYQRLYMEGGKNFYCINGSVPLTAGMLNVQYYLTDFKETDNDLITCVAECDGAYLYRNNYSLSLGYVIPEEAASAWEISDSKKINGINELARLLGAEENLLDTYACKEEETEGSTQITVEEDGYYYASWFSCQSDSLTFSYDNGKNTGWSKTTHAYLFDLGHMEAGSSVTITNRNQEKIGFQVYRLNTDALDRAYRTLSEQTFSLEHYTSTRIEGSIDMTEGGRLVFPIANESGWTLYVDGKETDIQNFSDTFISVSLGTGKHEILLTYETPGLKAGMMVSGCCFLIFVLLMLARLKRTRR